MMKSGASSRSGGRGLLVMTVLGLLVATSASALASSNHAQFFEIDQVYRGVDGKWTDADWSNNPCPPDSSGNNSVLTWVNAYGNVSNSWVQIGSWKKRFIDVFGFCQASYYYYWERKLAGEGAINSGISSPLPIGTHKFSLNRLTTGCQSGANWCWHFRIDGVTKHTCCHDQSELAYSSQVSFGTECKYVSGSTCQVQGVVDPVTELSWKSTSDNWSSWAGQDGECADYGNGARAKWISATSVKAGWNVSMTNPIQGDSCS
jgi:hypothetical protein